MAASHTLPHSHAIRKSGVLVLNGYGIRVQVNTGHLLAHDGIADERRTIRLPRVNHGLKRLVMIGSDGFVTLEALRWLADQGAALRANIDETLTAALITEQGGKEKHRERSQEYCSFPSQFAGSGGGGQAAAAQVQRGGQEADSGGDGSGRGARRRRRHLAARRHLLLDAARLA